MAQLPQFKVYLIPARVSSVSEAKDRVRENPSTIATSSSSSVPLTMPSLTPSHFYTLPNMHASVHGDIPGFERPCHKLLLKIKKVKAKIIIDARKPNNKIYLREKKFADAMSNPFI